MSQDHSVERTLRSEFANDLRTQSAGSRWSFLLNNGVGLGSTNPSKTE